MITTKRVFLIIFAACLLAMAPSVILADGGGNPPTVPEGYKYDPPPYLGTVSLEWVPSCTFGDQTFDKCVFVYGRLEPAGEKRDPLVFSFPGLLLETGVPLEVFQTHKANDIRTRIIGHPYPYFLIGIYEIIGAHRLVYTSDTLFTVDVVLMKLSN